MSFMNPIRLGYIIACYVIIVFLLFFLRAVKKNNNQYASNISILVIIGIISIALYGLFLFCGENSHYFAVLTDSLFFVGTDWLALYMMIFAVDYTGIGKKYKKNFLYLFSTLCLIDSVSLIVSAATAKYFVFDLIWTIDSLSNGFWANAFNIPHYIHLSLCYVMVLTTFIFFLYSTWKAPSFYKKKYIYILIVYIIVIIANFVSYSLNFPLDFSVILYALQAAFIGFFSNWLFPAQLLNQGLQSVNQTTSDGVIYFDIYGHCIYYNTTAERIFAGVNGFNKTQAEMYRTAWISNVSKENDDLHIGTDIFNIGDYEHHYSVEYRVEKIKGQEIGYCLRFIDKTLEITNSEKERYASTHDELTGILNRVGFFAAVDQLIYEESTIGWVMIISNINDFKLVNELFGYEMGDRVLLRQAGILQRFSHSDTVFGRISDDKFAVYTRKENFKEERFGKFINELQTITVKSKYHMQLSVGVYVPQGRNEKAYAMYDKALMAIKNSKKDYSKTFYYYSDDLLEAKIKERLISEEFEDAISLNQIKMFLQPIIDVKNHTFGAEALCRWQHPVNGRMLPSEFLPILEQYGLICQLDMYVWEIAAKKLHEWNEKGFNDCYISVNISVKDFYYTDIYKTFTRLVELYDINPASLHIEITETVLMSDFGRALSLARKLQKAGFCVAIDNFGNGYSSLNMLKDFDADYLKIDMTILRDAPTDEKTRIILEAVIDMAKALDAKIVGTGVEQKPQYDLLGELDCEILQGNYLFEPMAIEEFEEKFVNFFTTK